MRAVYTYWATGRDEEKLNGGFRNTRELALMTALSIEEIRKDPSIDKVQLVTNDFGKSLLIDRYGLEFDEVEVILNHLDDTLDQNLWAYAKICAFAHQKEPFIHLDTDVILWDNIPQRVLDAPASFQCVEGMGTAGGYNFTFEEAKFFIAPIIKNNKPDFAYNCGIVAANDLSLIKKWFDVVTDFIFNPKNKVYWDGIASKHNKNHLFEQFFISALIKVKDIKAEVLIPDFSWGNLERPSFKMTHLWGETKREDQYMQKIKGRMKRDYPAVYNRITEGVPDHTDIFANVYRTNRWGNKSGGGSDPKVTVDYQNFLSDFMLEKDIKTVVDLGCGYWDSNDQTDWTGIEYTGIDCVESVQKVNRNRVPESVFITADVLTYVPKEPVDLLIIKDVFIHWRNHEIIEFIDRIKKSGAVKYILTTNDDHGNVNVDIEIPGEFHSLDLTKRPFKVKGDNVHLWASQQKTTFLIEM